MGCVQSRESDHLPSLSLRAYTRRRSMSKPHKKNRPPKHVLALPDLEQCKTAVLNTLTSKSGQRSYDRAITDFVDWYCLMCCLTGAIIRIWRFADGGDGLDGPFT